jgi:hypothetical protein
VSLGFGLLIAWICVNFFSEVVICKVGAPCPPIAPWWTGILSVTGGMVAGLGAFRALGPMSTNSGPRGPARYNLSEARGGPAQAGSLIQPDALQEEAKMDALMYRQLFGINVSLFGVILTLTASSGAVWIGLVVGAIGLLLGASGLLVKANAGK